MRLKDQMMTRTLEWDAVKSKFYPSEIFYAGQGNAVDLPFLKPLEKPLCRSGSNRLVPNRKRSTSRLYIVTLLI